MGPKVTLVAILMWAWIVYFFFGCSTSSQWKPVTGYPTFNGLSRFEDRDNVCYLFLKNEYPALSCLHKSR